MNAQPDPSAGLKLAAPPTAAAAPREGERAVGPIQVIDFDMSAPPVTLGDVAAPPPAADAPASHAAAVALSADGRIAAVATADGPGAAVSVRTAGEEFAAKSAVAEANAERLIEMLGRNLRPGMSPEIQKETAALIALISDMAYEEFTEFFPLLRIAVASVTMDPPNLTLAQQIRKDIRRRTFLLLRPLLFLRTGHPAVQVILGLLTNLVLALPIAVFLTPWVAVHGTLFPGTTDHVFVLIGVAGAVGSIVSMLVRIKDFDNEEAEHRAILFFTGFFKPAIGVASALFIVLLLEANLINIGLGEETVEELFLFLSVAFVAGFSERLASDIVSQTEGRIKNKPADEAKG